MKQLISTIIVALIVRSAQSQASRGKSVVVSMDAKWPDTPILSEARYAFFKSKFDLLISVFSEYMNEESKQLFWKFLNRVSNSDPAELQKSNTLCCLYIVFRLRNNCFPCL